MSTVRGETTVNSPSALDAARDFVIVAVIALAPLLMLPGLFFHYDVTPKVAVILLGTAAALILQLRTRSNARSREARWLVMLALAQCVSLLVSTLLSVNRALSAWGSSWRRFGLIEQIAVLVFAWLILGDAMPRRVAAILRAAAAGGIVAAGYGIAQYFGWDPWQPAAAYRSGEGAYTIVRTPGTLGHAAYFANYLVYVVFAGAALLMSESRTAWRAAGGCACALGSAAILLSGTRASLAGLAAGGLFLALWFRPRITPRRGGCAAAVIAVLVLFYFSPAGAGLRSRVHWTLEEPRGGARPWLWLDTLRLAADHWAAGIGPETFSLVFPRYQSVELSRAFPDFYHESPHNIFLDALASQGVAGLLLLLLLAAVGFAALRRAAAASRTLAGVLGAALLASLVSQMFGVFVPATALFFYITIASLAGMGGEAGRGLESLSWRWLPVKLACALVFTVFAVRLLAADHALASVRRLMDAGRIPEAAQRYRQVLAWAPPGLNADLWYSRSMIGAAQKSPNFLRRVQAAQQALEAAERATQSSEEPAGAWYSLAALYAARSDFPRTESSLRAAIAASPNWYKPHWTMAQALRLAGRMSEARDEAKRAVDLGGGRHEEVTRTWNELRQQDRGR